MGLRDIIDARWESRPSDPITDMLAAVKRIKEEPMRAPQNKIVMAKWAVQWTVDWLESSIRRATKFLQKPLLSGNYQKRRRQLVMGIKAVRLRKRERCRKSIALWSRDLRHWKQLAEMKQEYVEVDPCFR